MAVLTTQFSVGDTVFHAGTVAKRKQHDCPDCKGARKWKAVSPAGEEYEFACPRCATSYQSNSSLNLNYTAYTPVVGHLTIGSVAYEAASSWDEGGAKYMCRETGVGSGTIYRESDLFATEEEALAAATAKANLQNAETTWVVNLYNKTLELSDYQLQGAVLKQAKEIESRTSCLLWNVRDLFDKQREAETLDEAIEALDEYVEWSWRGDLKDVEAKAIEARSGETERLDPKDESAAPTGFATKDTDHV